jgi:hypothetical protein
VSNPESVRRVSRFKMFRAFFILVWLAWSLQFVKAAQITSGYPPVLNDQWANTAEHLTLSGCLILGVTMLWRELGKKDTLLVQSTGTVTGALSAAAASNVELRRIIENYAASLTHATDEQGRLTEAINLLTARIERLPCTDVFKKKI